MNVSGVTSEEKVELEEILDVVEDLSQDGKLKKGEKILDEKKSLFEKNGDLTYVRYLLKRGHLCIKRSQWSEARDYFKQANSEILIKEPDEDWDTLSQEVFIGLGKISWRTCMYYDAQVYLKRALELSSKKDLNRAKIHIEMANVLADTGEFEHAIDNYHKAIRILEPLGDTEELTRTYNNIADTFMQAEDFESCLDYALKCIEISEQVGNKRQESWGYLTGGEALVKMGYVDIAKEYLDGVRAGFGNSEEDYLQGSLFKLEAMVEAGDSNFQGAKTSFVKAREHLEYAGMPYYSAQLDYEEANMYKVMGNFSMAKKFYDRALSTFREQRCKAEIKKLKRDIKDLEFRQHQISID
jgi:tetratricopeptide (TPR) repeat protein